MDRVSLSKLTEADLGSDFSEEDEQGTDFTSSDLGLNTGRPVTLGAPDHVASGGRGDGHSYPKFGDVFSRHEQFQSNPSRPLNLRPSIVSAIEGNEPSLTTVVSLDVLPPKYRSFFSDYSYFNIVQSKVYGDIMNGDHSIALCSPTGSGKTVVMELAIMKLLMDHERCSYEPFKHKIVYMSPLKGICNEKYLEWAPKFAELGVIVCEITGDSDERDYCIVYKSNLIVTTPEKWDSMTRKWKKERQTLMSSVKLVLIDEVHQLSDESRGACLEAVVTRIKTAKRDVRFIAVSATAPNIDDVATWLGRPDLPGKYLRMGEEFRPVKLNSFVRGFPKFGSNDYLFDKYLEKHVPPLVNEFSQSKPTLVFCMTRKGTVSAAKTMAESNNLNIPFDQRVILQQISLRIKDPILRELVKCGVAYHHAGVDRNDRIAVETGFTASQILVLFCTSTLSQGVNFPAHLVIVKGTTRCAGQMSTTEYSETEIQQMIGRAGRPQFDECGVAVIMTSDKETLKYERLLRGEKILESYIHRNLPEHLNAEIVLETVTNVPGALEWLRSTFFYIRCRKSRCLFYGLKQNLNDTEVESRLQEICNKELYGLVEYHMITMDGYRHEVKPTEVGRLMAHYYMSLDTMKTFVEMKPRLMLKDVLQLICNCKELGRDIELRVEDKKFLYSFHGKKKDEPMRTQVRFINADKIKTRAHKISTLLQIEFGMIHEDQLQKYRLDISKLIKSGARLTRCLAEFAVLPDVAKEKGFITVRNCIMLSKCFRRGLWENTPFVAKQFDGIGPKYARDLCSRSLSTIESIASCDPRVVDGILNRKNNKVIELARKLPKYCLKATQIVESVDEAKIELEVSIENWKEVSRAPTAGKQHFVYLLVGDEFDNVLVAQKVKDEDMLTGEPFVRTFTIKKSATSGNESATKGTEFQVSVLSESWIGIDLPRFKYVITSFPYFRKNIQQVLSPLGLPKGSVVDFPSVASPAPAESSENLDAFSEFDDIGITRGTDPSKCKHTCRDKSRCKHTCCKSGPKSGPNAKRVKFAAAGDGTHADRNTTN